MPHDVKRAYSSPTRDRRSDATRERILGVARDLFLERGYRATTIAEISRRAGVHPDTIYAAVGRKPEVLRELLERGLSGTDHVVPAADRTYVAAIRGAGDPVEKIRIYASATRAMLERTASLFGALADAATTDRGARALHDELRRRRAANMRDFVADLASVSPLSAELSLDEAADVVWATNSPEMYRLLVDERGWAPDRYERWLADAWCRVLLDLGPRPGEAGDGDPSP